MNTSQTVEKKGKRYHHGDLKAQLVEATRALVEEQGPDHFSVAQACRLAGVSTAAPYRHFETRQDMLDAVAEEGLERMTSSLRHAAAAHPRGSIEAVTELGRAYVAFAGREPGVYRLMFSSEADRPEERVAEMREQGMRCFGVVLGEVAQHMGAGPEDPRVL
ncbi:MAG: TetR/AcrR family transcriptional regulator, partial [Pseudomonadota bacterium]